MDKFKQKIQKSFRFDAWQRWEYKHTTLVILSLLVFIILLDTSFMTTMLEHISKLAYFGVFLGGILFVSLFTAVPAVVLLLSFEGLSLPIVALVAGLGAMVGDYLILKFVEDKVAYEIKPIAYRFGIPQAVAYLQGKKSTLGLVRVTGALIIASPLPDELGIGLLGIGRLSQVNFLLICYVLNVAGIFLLLLGVSALA